MAIEMCIGAPVSHAPAERKVSNMERLEPVAREALDMLLEDGLAKITADPGDTLTLRLGKLEVAFQELNGGLWCVGSGGGAK